MKKSITAILILFILSVSLSGCAPLRYSVDSIAGVNMQDLESERADRVTRSFNLPYQNSYDMIMETLKKNKITVYLSDINKGYIVAIGFPKQESTTRVGIFFDSISDDRTEITLSSLSSTCLVTAEPMIFGDETVASFIIY